MLYNLNKIWAKIDRIFRSNNKAWILGNFWLKLVSLKGRWSTILRNYRRVIFQRKNNIFLKDEFP